MCVHCIDAAKETGLRGRLCSKWPPSSCCVLCPCCQHPVELPCWKWSSATACLPHYPTLRFDCVRKDQGSAPKDQLQHTEEVRNSIALSILPATSVSPLDGATELEEDDMKRSVHGLHFSLNPSTAHPSLHLSDAPPTVTISQWESRGAQTTPTVCADAVLTQGQFYWEVDVCNSALYRIGVMSSDGCAGWWFQRQGNSFSAVYDGSSEPLSTVPPHIRTIGLFLCIGAGTLSFHNPLTEEHLATLPTIFGSAGVVPAVGLGQGRLRLRSGLPPPCCVFFYNNSAYREPGSSRRGWRNTNVGFWSVKTLIQKFEELVVSPPPESRGSTGLPVSD
ncbi:probable E3 ubiquitin-protein ligase MID2 [Gouania willdenowi]|uniref:probable E3 ubiquitin-protein ligase MID2 n=1 Tax=Gouania willdenowi TaxID=441366 RepID=UPI001055469F|nr:probable E3 ubiquitin-protein ligase MID2 [Gouania willdenowi]